MNLGDGKTDRYKKYSDSSEFFEKFFNKKNNHDKKYEKGEEMSLPLIITDSIYKSTETE